MQCDWTAERGPSCRYVIVPLSRNATFTVIILSLVGGLRGFDLIWTMTGGGPGFTTDVVASAIFKRGLPGRLLWAVHCGERDPLHRREHHHLPLDAVSQSQGNRPVRLLRKWWSMACAGDRSGFVLSSLRLHHPHRGQGSGRGVVPRFHLPTEWHLWDNLGAVSPPVTASSSRLSGTAWS